MDPRIFCEIACLVICDGGEIVALIGAEGKVSVDMYLRLIRDLSACLQHIHTGVGVDDHDIGIPVIGEIFIYEPEIFSGNPVAFDAVAGKNIILHPIIAYEQMTATFLDPMAGIIKQIIDIEL